MVLRKIVKPWSLILLLRLFLKLLKPQSPAVVFNTKKKSHMDDYVDRKYYYEKYFEMGTILTVFFYKRIILDLNSTSKLQCIELWTSCFYGSLFC